MQYRKIPVIINAMQLPSVIDIAGRLAFDNWITSISHSNSRKCRYVSDKIHINTLEGTMIGDVDDYIICGVKGEFYPCKPDIFELTYEKVE